MWRSILFYDSIAKEYFPKPVKHTLLCHESDLTVLYIKDLVNFIRGNGWKIVTAEEAYADTLLSVETDHLVNNQGRVMALAISRGYKGPIRNYDENTKVMDELFKKYEVWEK